MPHAFPDGPRVVGRTPRVAVGRRRGTGAAVREDLGDRAGSQPRVSLFASLGVTFPFNILVGIPLHHTPARYLYRAGS